MNSMIRLGTFASMSLAVMQACAAFYGWTGRGAAGVFDDPANFDIADAEAFSNPNKCVSGSNSQIGGIPSGTFTLKGDAYFNRFVLDRAYQQVNLDFGAHTGYFVGIDSIAFGATAAGNGSVYKLQSGTLCVPDTFNGATYNYARFSLPRNSNETTSEGLRFIVEAAQGASPLLRVNTLIMPCGRGNVVKIASGGTLQVRNPLELQAGGMSNKVIVADGGVWKNWYDSPSTAEERALLLTAFAGMANGHAVEFLNGGKVEGFEYLRVGPKGSRDFKVTFSGTGTDVTFANTESGAVSILDGVNNRIEVKNGAKVSFSTLSGGQGRIWIGTDFGSDGNVLSVSGEGSSLSFASSGSLVGQWGGNGNGIEVSDRAVLRLNGLRIGQNNSHDSYVKVWNGACLVDNATFVGYGDGNLTFRNRLEVFDNGVVSNRYLYVGRHPLCHGNVVEVSDGGKIESEETLVIGYNNVEHVQSGGCNRFTVGADGLYVCGGDAAIGQSDKSQASRVTTNNVLEVLAGGVFRCGGSFFDYGSNSIVRVGGEMRVGGMIYLPYYGDGNWSETVEIFGPEPKLIAEGSGDSYVFSIRRGARVVFTVPKEGWADAPLQAPNGLLRIFDDGTDAPEVSFDLDAFLAANGGVGGCVTLARANRIDVKSETLTSWQAALQAKYPKCKLIVDERQLVLKTPSGKGIMLIFR